VRTIAQRLSLPVGAKGAKGLPGGYRSRQEWFAKSRRLQLLQDRLERERADREAGRVRVVRGGRKLLRSRHNLQASRLTEAQWRVRWEAERWFLQADGEFGKRYGNETIRVSPGGEVSVKLPAPLAGLANGPHGRYVLACRVGFRHRGEQWADRIAADRAVAYRIHYDVARGRWYLTASWRIPPVRAVSLEAARSGGLVRTGRPLAIMRQRWRSAGAPWDTRSGDGRHRPRTTNGVSPARAKPRAWGRSCGASDRPGRTGCPGA